jgi:aldehyde:ferredoxin oxidoreductase
LCSFGRFGLDENDIVDMFNCVCGVGETAGTLRMKGERIVNLERLWNLSAGFTKADDTLPKRLLEEPVTKGPSKGEVNRLYEMLPKYYHARGWDENGIPTRAKLGELGLEKYAVQSD